MTVAIVEQRIDNSFYSDLNSFSSKYGLPDPNITVLQSYGSCGTLSTDEITADAEFVHAMAPDAKILPVVVGSALGSVSECSGVPGSPCPILARIGPSSDHYCKTCEEDEIDLG